MLLFKNENWGLYEMLKNQKLIELLFIATSVSCIIVREIDYIWGILFASDLGWGGFLCQNIFLTNN